MRTNHSTGKLMSVVKKTDAGFLSANGDTVHIDYVLDYEFYCAKNGYYPTTKKVFDTMFNSTIEKLKSLGE